MGWGSGSELAEDLWTEIRSYINKKDHMIVAKKVIKLFENMDCDTLDECEELQIAARSKKYK